MGRLRLLVGEPRLDRVFSVAIAVGAENLRGVGYLRILRVPNLDDKSKPRIEFGWRLIFGEYDRIYAFCDYFNRSRIHPLQSCEALIDKLPRRIIRQTECLQLRRLFFLEPLANGIPW